MEELTIAELLSSLRTAFRTADFERVEKILVEREESVAAAVRSSSSEALRLKDVEKVGLEAECQALRKEVEGIRSRSAQLEERVRAAEEGFRVLAAEQVERQREARGANAALEAKVSGLLVEKSAADAGAEKDRELCRKLEEQVVKAEEGQKVAPLREIGALRRIEEMKKTEQYCSEKILRLQAANRDLECALRTAEAEAMEWKTKYGDLEALSLRLVEENMSLKTKGQGITRKIGREDGSNLPTKRNRDGICENTKSLKIPKLEPENSDRKVDGAVREGAGPVSATVIEIIDSEDEMERKDHGCSKQNMAGPLGDNGDVCTKNFSNELHLDLENVGAVLDEGINSRENVLSATTPKRKRSSRVIMSDSESEDDEDKITKEEVKRHRVDKTEDCSSISSYSDDGNQELVTPRRRRLVPLSQGREAIPSRESATAVLSSTMRGHAVASGKGTVCRKLQYPVTEDVKDDEVHGDEDVESMDSDSEGESLGGFIVNELDSSDNECNISNMSEQEGSSDSSLDRIFSGISREKRSVKWEYEADMLASFGKDPVICMKAVCTLYRQQTAAEQSVKGTLLINNRGFNKNDARRGSSIAEFLTNGNPQGPLTRSVRQLETHDPTAVEYCYKLATRYSRQLFVIYKNSEDPYFLPT